MYTTRPPTTDWRELLSPPACRPPVIVVDLDGPTKRNLKTFAGSNIPDLIRLLRTESPVSTPKYRVIISLGPMGEETVNDLSEIYRLGPLFRAFQLSADVVAESARKDGFRAPENGRYNVKTWGPSWGPQPRPWFQKSPMVRIMHPPWRNGVISPDGKEWGKAYSLFYLTEHPEVAEDGGERRYVAFCAIPDLLRIGEGEVQRSLVHSWERDLLTKFPTPAEVLGDGNEHTYLCPAVAGFVQFLASPENFSAICNDPWSPALYMLACSSLGSQDAISHITPALLDHEEEDQYFSGGLPVYRAEISHWLRLMISQNILLLRQRFPLSSSSGALISSPVTTPPDPLNQPSNFSSQLVDSFEASLSHLDQLSAYIATREQLYITRLNTTASKHRDLISEHRNLEEKADRERARLLQDQNLEVARLSIQQSRAALEETRNVTLLTRLAFFYIPLTFVTSIFGMNIKELSGEGVELSVWVFVVTAVVVGGITYMILGTVYFVQAKEMKKEAREAERAAEESAKMIPEEPVVDRPVLWRSGKRWDPGSDKGVGGSIHRYPEIRVDGTPDALNPGVGSSRYGVNGGVEYAV